MILARNDEKCNDEVRVTVPLNKERRRKGGQT